MGVFNNFVLIGLEIVNLLWLISVFESFLEIKWGFVLIRIIFLFVLFIWNLFIIWVVWELFFWWVIWDFFMVGELFVGGVIGINGDVEERIFDNGIFVLIYWVFFWVIESGWFGMVVVGFVFLVDWMNILLGGGVFVLKGWFIVVLVGIILSFKLGFDVIDVNIVGVGCCLKFV